MGDIKELTEFAKHKEKLEEQIRKIDERIIKVEVKLEEMEEIKKNMRIITMMLVALRSQPSIGPEDWIGILSSAGLLNENDRKKIADKISGKS